jgi:hypothetical protein
MSSDVDDCATCGLGYEVLAVYKLGIGNDALAGIRGHRVLLGLRTGK